MSTIRAQLSNPALLDETREAIRAAVLLAKHSGISLQFLADLHINRLWRLYDAILADKEAELKKKGELHGPSPAEHSTKLQGAAVGRIVPDDYVLPNITSAAVARKDLK